MSQTEYKNTAGDIVQNLDKLKENYVHSCLQIQLLYYIKQPGWSCLTNTHWHSLFQIFFSLVCPEMAAKKTCPITFPRAEVGLSSL